MRTNDNEQALFSSSAARELWCQQQIAKESISDPMDNCNQKDPLGGHGKDTVVFNSSNQSSLGQLRPSDPEWCTMDTVALPLI